MPEIDQLTAKKNQLLKDVEALENAINTSKVKKEEIEAEIVAVQKQLAECNSHLATIQEAVESANANAKSVQEDIATAVQTASDNLNDVNATLDAAVAELNTVKVETETATLALTDTRADLARARTEHDTFVAEATTEKEARTVELNALKTSLAEHATTNQKAIDNGIEYSAKADTAKLILETVMSDTARSEEHLAQINASIETGVAERTTKIDELNTQLANKRAEVIEQAGILDGQIATLVTELESKTALALSIANREQEVGQRETFLREAGLNW